MTNFMAVTASCINLLGVLFFIREIVKIAIFVIPIALIVMLTLDFTKGVISFDFNDDKTLRYVTKRIIYAVVLLLVPTSIFGILKAVGIVVTDSQSCWAYVDEASVEDIKEKLENNLSDMQQETEDLIKEIASSSKMSVKDKESTRKIVSASKNDDNTNSNDSNDNTEDTSTNNGKITLDWNNLSKVSNISSAGKLSKAINKTKNLKKWEPYAIELYDAEKNNKVNVFFLVGLEAHESGLMKSSLSKDCNNLGGVKAKPTCSGHGSYKKFGTKNAFIKYHAKLLNKSYIKQGRKSLSSIKSKYCGSGCGDWISATKKFGNQLYNQAKKIK